MTKFIGMIPLNAENFESGEATEGQVLSADGSGGASWETPSGGGAIESVRVYPDVIVVTGAGSSEANGLYIKVPTTDPSYDPVYKDPTRRFVLTCEDDEYWFISDSVTDSSLYGAAGGITTPIADLEWEVNSGVEPVPTVIADTNYTGNAFNGDLLTADGDGGVTWETPPAFTELVLILGQSGTDAPTAIEIVNTTGQGYTLTRVAVGVYSLVFDNPVMKQYQTVAYVSNPDSITSGNPPLIAKFYMGDLRVYNGFLSTDRTDNWQSLYLTIRTYE